MRFEWDAWIEQGGDPGNKPLRQAVHIAILAISKCGGLNKQMMLKGGILMALCYGSARYTKDIDFSQIEKYQPGEEIYLLEELSQALVEAVEEVDYGLDCKIQSSALKPPSQRNPTFPTLNVKIGYAYKHDLRNHRRLLEKNSTFIVELDFSFNETTQSAETFDISGGHELLRYSLADLVAEKFRALLQQEDRNRYRRQDVYDLYYLIQHVPSELEDAKRRILNALIKSASSKGLEINSDSMRIENIRKRTRHEYDLLIAELPGGDLPDFDVAYEAVKQLYESLPWNSDNS
jgi:predicted nucleotidyltransferase component of viral defense system